MFKSFLICAVVVTYNRKELLMNCLAALARQTVPLNKVFIINNASTDGTKEFLQNQGYLENPFYELITLEQNLGGAGGFYHGIKTAFERGFDKIFLMDDDGFPADNCLEQLLIFSDDNLCVGSLVLNKDNPDQLCFPIRLPGKTKTINNVFELKQAHIEYMIPDILIPFNGVLLSKELISLCGYPKPEYFIWGDDIEYIWRLKKNGVKLGTVISSYFFHPREVAVGTPMFFGKMRFNDSSSLIKLYCMARNNTVNLLEYKNKVTFVIFFLKAFWFYTLTKPSKTKLKIVFKGIKDGLKRDFTHHKEFLN